LAEALDVTKECFALADSRCVEADYLVGIQAELYRQQLLRKLYVGAI
jgi:hypothetical protein